MAVDILYPLTIASLLAGKNYQDPLAQPRRNLVSQVIHASTGLLVRRSSFLLHPLLLSTKYLHHWCPGSLNGIASRALAG